MARVLVIDDSKFARQTCRELLTKIGHDVIEAATGQEGLEVTGRESPDVIVLDLLMPGLAGHEVLKTLQQQHPSIPVIVMTADSQKKTAELCLALGAVQVINKFVDPDELNNAVRHALGREGQGC
jgi:CheY-like chemotaxis protein